MDFLKYNYFQGVESETCASFQNAFSGSDHSIKAESSLADGLAVPTVGVNAVFMAKGIIDELITVCEVNFLI